MSDSEQAKSASAATGSADKATAAEARPTASTPPRGGRGLAVIALLLALVALGGIAYMDFTFRPLYSLTARLEGEAGQLAALRADLERRIDALEADARQAAQLAGEMQTAAGEQTDALAELTAQLDALNSRLDAITGIDSGRRNRLLQAEATYYLRIANAQAMLAGNSELAASALRMADDRLRETADPVLAPVRRQLSDELAALDALPALDTAGLSFRLQALNSQVGDWPLANPVPERFRIAGGDSPGADSVTAWERLRQTVADAFSSIVSVRQVDAPPELRLSEAERALVVESVRAELQLARLTLVTGELTLYQQSVTRAAEQIGRYFDAEATAVAAALATLSELQNAELPGAMPDISGSLSLLLKTAPAGEEEP